MRLIGLVLLSVCAFAQSRGDGYAFFSMDRPPHATLADILTVGGGGEYLLYKGLGVGADLGYQFARGSAGSGVGLASVGGVYQFAGHAKLVPFVTGGYGIAFRSGHLNLYHFGGGVNYWFVRRLGLRAELREFRHRHGEYVLALRVGLAFR
jgi:hypothetical protein